MSDLVKNVFHKLNEKFLSMTRGINNKIFTIQMEIKLLTHILTKRFSLKMKKKRTVTIKAKQFHGITFS